MTGIALALAFAYVAKLYMPLVDKAISAYKDTHTPPVVPKATPAVPLPSNVSALVNRHQDDWAREMVAGRARELYEETGDWGAVAHQLEQEDGIE